MLKLFRKRERNHLTEWNRRGEEYARKINAMIAFGETHGWEKWKGKEPQDRREHLADKVLEDLRKANETNTTSSFRQNCPPGHAPFINHFEQFAQDVSDIHFIENGKLLFLTGSPWAARHAYLMENGEISRLDKSIVAIGKSSKGDCFAIADGKRISTWFGWKKVSLYEFNYPVRDMIITRLIPYNDGSRVLLVSSAGIYLVSEDNASLIHPVPDLEDPEWTLDIDMEHAALSPDNELICVGDQCSEHRILNSDLEELAEVGPQSSYPHFAMFSKDGSRLLLNSCHFYNGVTIAVSTADIGKKPRRVPAQPAFTLINDECRVYTGIAADGYYILGEAYGYIKAYDEQGKKLWQHFLGSTVSGMALSPDGTVLFVGCHSGILHELHLGKGHRDQHTIGTGNHYEANRWIFWKNEERPLRW